MNGRARLHDFLGLASLILAIAGVFWYEHCCEAVPKGPKNT
jgi:hypothetical protein